MLLVYLCAREQRKTNPTKYQEARREGEPERFWERPAKKFVENLPPSEQLLPPKVPSRSQKAVMTAQAATGGSWLARGPFPIPNGQTEGRVDPVSGRVTAIAVHPTNSSIAYVGTAQGGLYRTLDGGTTWTQLMDNAPGGVIGTPLAIGAVAIDPTNPANVVVGTGEGNLSIDSYFGCGLYIITNADGSSPIINGPYTQRQSDGVDIFTGRSIVAIAIDPTNHNNLFCATSSGVGGIVPSSYSVLPPRGLYRSRNAFAGIESSSSPRFERLTVEPSETNAIVTSAVIDPANASTLVCALYSQNGSHTGGIYRATNALDSNPTFTHTVTLDDFINVKLAVNRLGSTLTVYAATEEGNPNGRLYRSNDGGLTFGPALTAANGFAGTQGFYDIAIAVDPTAPERVLLGGNTGTNIFLYSNNGGNSFASSTTGLHADVHAIAIAPSNPSVIYHGNDGGVWKSVDLGLDWVSLNNTTFSATQFVGLALHPVDPQFSIGGTQDNGTELLQPNGTFRRADFGDGGYSLIDRNASDNTTVTMYHTYFNVSDDLIGTARVLNSNCALDGGWSFHGSYGGTVDTSIHCDGSTDTFNGISIGDAVNFYAPQVLGPGNPNTWYFGTNRLYRSTNRADTATAFSQTFEADTPISAIAISPQDDNVRVVGLDDGKVYATPTGSSFLLQIAGPGATNGTTGTPAVGVGRIAIDPNDKNVAYLCFTGYGTPGNPVAHIWKTTNLNSSSVTFTPASAGLPDVPVNAIAIDPTATEGRSTSIYAGTDVGVYYSAGGGDSWSVYGSGFPHVAVFGLEIQSAARIVRAATHGRGLYEIAAATPGPVGDTATKLVNVSTRGPVESGDSVMIAGLITKGPETKNVIIRGIGPSMVNFGVSTALSDPTITLYNSQGTQLAYNDDYTSNSSADLATLASNNLTPSDSRESAIVTSLPAGVYTAILRGKTNGTGLVEVYDINRSSFSSILNISTRGKVEQDDDGVMIAGFIVGAPSGLPGKAQRILVRADGPSLSKSGVKGVMADPTMDIYRGFTKIYSNDDWKTQTSPGVASANEIKATGLAPSNDKEPAILASFDPGTYTAIIRGSRNTTGVALAEAYIVNP